MIVKVPRVLMALLILLLLSIVTIIALGYTGNQVVNKLLNELAYPEFSDKNTYRIVMDQEKCFEEGGIWWLYKTSECGFKRKAK